MYRFHMGTKNSKAIAKMKQLYLKAKLSGGLFS